MSNDFTFSLKRIAFDEHYQPAGTTLAAIVIRWHWI